MTAMSAAIWTGTNEFQVRETTRPQVRDGWALVRIAYNGICGTDLSIHHGQHPRAQHGLVPGHEMSGWVEIAAETGPREGTPVVVEPLISCGECHACRSGATHVCQHLGLYGIDTDGGMAEYVALPPKTLHEVPAHVDLRTAALAEPVAVAVHAVRLSGMSAGDTVAVFGAGPIGLLTALVARHKGAERIVVTEPSAWRRSIAVDLGFTVVPESDTMTSILDELTEGDGADVTFDAAAHPSVSAQLADATRVLGRIIIVGVYKAPTALDLQAICFKEQSLVGVRVYTTEDVHQAIELIASGELTLDTFPTAVYDVADIATAFDAAASGQDALKIMVTPLVGKAHA